MSGEPIEASDPSTTLSREGTLAQSPEEQARAAAASIPSVVVPGYDIECELGRGGMGVVYKARQTGLNRLVALKMLIAGMYSDPASRARFLLEAESVAALEHPNIVQVFAFGEHNGHPFLVMELLSNGNLADRVKANGALSPLEATTLVTKLAEAVAHAHSRGVVHRDIKPGNVLLTSAGEPRLTDFGLAKVDRSKLSATGQVLGTPAYMAPEQAAGKVHEVGTPADVYALGAVLYDLLTGRPPLVGDCAAATIQLVLTAEPEPLRKHNAAVPRDLETICLKCLQKDPVRRYATAQAVADDLKHFLKGEPITARPTGPLERTVKWVKRNKGRAATLAGAMLIPITAAGFYYYDRLQKAHARQQQETYERELAAREIAELSKLGTLRQENIGKLQARNKETLLVLDGIRDMMLRGKLRNVSGLDPLRSKLILHYKRLNEQLHGEADYDRASLARSWVEVGRLIHETGRKDVAWEAFRQANELFKSVTPVVPETRIERAEAEMMCGRLAFELNRIDEARTSCDEIEALLSGTDSVPKCAGRLAEMWQLRGEIFHNELHSEASLLKAAEAYDKSIAFRMRALGETQSLSVEQFIEHGKHDPDHVKTDLDNLQGLATAYAYQGRTWRDGNHPDKALQSYSKAHQIREKIVAILRPLSVSDARYGLELSFAESHLARDPSNIAYVHLSSRALVKAKDYALQSLELRKKVTEENPNILSFRFDLCFSSNMVADMKMMLGDYHGVSELLDVSVKVPKDRLETQGGYSVESITTLANARVLRAQYYAFKPMPDLRQAKEESDTATKLLAELYRTNPSDPYAAFYRAIVAALNADSLAPTGAAAEGLRARSQADVLEALEQAIKLGYRNKHPDDICEMRVFRKFKDDAKFKGLIEKLRVAREQLKAGSAESSTPAP